jgi:endoribonuclease Dicer
MLLEYNASGNGQGLPGNANANKETETLLDKGCDHGAGASAANAYATLVNGVRTAPAAEDKLHDEQPTTTNSSKDDDGDYEKYLLDRSDTEDVPVKPILPTEGRRKKLADRAAALKWVVDHEGDEGIEQDENDDIIRPLKSPSARRATDESAKIIDKARDYQQELFERAKEDNIIAVLDTGSGKTLIACLLIKHVLEQELHDREKGKPHRTVVFLVNSVHLVIQQGQVLADNLANPPAILHGSINYDLWKRETWNGILESNQVVVCTAEVLRQALTHNFISVGAISLLIFDECHHTKKNHPYALIIADYMRPSTAGQRRPKIFGMTASPMHTKGDVMKASGDLETLLHSKIVTTANMSLLEHSRTAKNEEWTYDRPRRSFDTQLTQQVKLTCDIEELRQYLQFAHDATSTLGTWAADQLWSYIFSVKEANSLVKKHEQSEAYQQIETSEEREQRIHLLERMAIVVQNLEVAGKFGKPDLDAGVLSSKVVVLAQQLKRRYSENSDLRTIVFVEQRLTAELLADCFAKLQFDNLRPGVLLGANRSSRSYGPQGSLSNKQQTVMEHFRNGWINCVFATNVAEEGIDIPQCSLVIRFDLFKTTIQYMQSRGRARMKDSVYAMLVEKDNEEQRGLIDYAIESEEYVKLFCSKMPEDRMLHSTEAREKRLVEKYAGGLVLVTNSGTRCSLNESLVILSRYASSLRYTGALTTAIHYELDCKDGKFRYSAKLSDGTASLGMEKIRGEWMPNKSLAKKSAAWYCCYQLHKHKLLDENLDSIHVRTQHKNNNAKWAVDNKKEKYETKIKPDFWRRGSPVVDKLYAAVIRLNSSRRTSQPLKAFVLFSRDPLPDIPHFPLYLEDNISTEVDIERIPVAILVTPKELNDLTAYTLRSVFEDVFHKTYAHDNDAISYWLAPFNETKHQIAGAPSFEHIVSVPELCIAQNDRTTWEPGMATDLWCHKFLVDKYTGAFRYISYDVVPGATIHSPVPKSAMGVPKKRKVNVEQFTNGQWKKTRERNAIRVDLDQPVFECDLFQARRDFLDKAKVGEIAKNAIRCLVVPQQLEVGRLPPAMAFTIMAWPSILHRLESYLIALEAFSKLDLQVPADLALEAFTAIGDNDDDGDQTHSASLRGMGKNYERLEFIGDSLLKMTTTMTVFCIKSKAAESDLHCDRMQMLCNNNLFNVSKDESLKLYQYARTNGFNRTTWYPEGLVLTIGRGVNTGLDHAKVYQDLGKKTIADISEAIIGASYQASRHLPDRFDMGLKAITLLVRDEFHPVMRWSNIAPLYKPQRWQELMNDPWANNLAVKVEKSVGIEYHFKHPRLVRSALTHASDMNSPVPDYQRLEFLGDAVLDMVSISWMFNKYEDKNPQWLTEHKMAMVSNKFLAALAVTLGFDKLMIASNVALQGHVIDYAKRVREVWDQGRDKIRRDFWTEIENEPKSLSDLVEAFIGALIVDSGFDYALVERFFEKHILWFFEDLDLYAGYANRHPTTFLYQRLTDEFKCTNYNVECIEREGLMNVKITAAVLIHHEVIETSTGDSSRYARVRVSKKALQRLDGLTIEQFREKFHCNCKRKANLSAEIEREKMAAPQNGA